MTHKLSRLPGAVLSLTMICNGVVPAWAGRAQAIAANGRQAALGVSLSLTGLSMPVAPRLPGPVLRPRLWQPASARVVQTRAGYRVVHLVLRTMANQWGLGFSLPLMGGSLAEGVMNEAAQRRVLFIDRDDTLTRNVEAMTEAQAAPLLEGLRNGKFPVVITDRPADAMENDPGNSAFEKLAPLLVPAAAGMLIGTNRGGRVYRLDADGRPQSAHEVPPFSTEEQVLIRSAVDAVVAELPKLGTGLNPSKGVDLEPHSGSVLLRVGTPLEIVHKAAGILQEALEKRGIRHEVVYRMPANPAQPPYISFSKVDKASAVAWVAQEYGIRAEEAVGVGDGMMAPINRKGSWSPAAQEAADLGRFLSGRDVLLKGSAKDANMQKGLFGMMLLSVGLFGDPRLENIFVLPEFGPDMTARFLRKWAAVE
ncbi:MAG: hypothetical protein HY921_08480 [Elusimicrobia bacterium]|nr:hypothetical protein [Elusimicrobiota bacterium]